eukprot:147983-Prymnesium_polylepis.1
MAEIGAVDHLLSGGAERHRKARRAWIQIVWRGGRATELRMEIVAGQTPPVESWPSLSTLWEDARSG